MRTLSHFQFGTYTAGALAVAFSCAIGCAESKMGATKGEKQKQKSEKKEKHSEDRHAAGKEDQGAAHEVGDDDDHHEAGLIKLNDKIRERIGLKTEEAQRRPLPSELTTTGEVDFDQDALAHVSARLGGRVVDVRKTLGDDVEQGTWLVVLESIELGKAKAALLQAAAIENVARLALVREERLFKDQIAPEREVLEAKGRYLTAKSDLDVAKETLRLYGLSDKAIASVKFGDRTASSAPVRAPISGRVVDKHVTRGELVTPEKSLFTIADLSSVWVWIDLFERDLPIVHVGDDVAVSAAAVPGRIFVGKIGYIKDEVDRDTRAVRARIDVKNIDRKLKPGMFATVQIADPHGEGGTGEASQGLAVPVSALVQDGAKVIVFVEEADGVFESRDVTLGRRSAQVVEVLAGVREGERVVTSGTFFLKSEAKKDSLSESEHSH